MNIKYSILSLFFFCGACIANQGCFRGVDIVPYNKQLGLCGTDNCNMDFNGEVFVIQKILPYSKIIFDVGANAGEWSSKALISNPNINLYCFEPIPSIYYKLKVCLDKFSSEVHTYQIAVSSCDGQKDFFVYDKNESISGLSSCYRRDESIEKKLNIMPKKNLVCTRSLDSFCYENLINHIDFLKIDTEGSELDILKGAANLLKNHEIDVIQFEYGGTYLSAHIRLQQVYELFISYGYKIFQILPEQLMYISYWIPEIENYRYSNFLAISPDLITI
jgi:FkbM family methyltransferase